MTLTAPIHADDAASSDSGLISVGEVAANSGVAPSAVRFYDTHGVITAVRTPHNQRRFDHTAVCRIRVAKLAQRVGLTVREIAELFRALPAEPTPTDWARVADNLISQAEERVADLRTHLDALGSDEKLCDIGAKLEY